MKPPEECMGMLTCSNACTEGGRQACRRIQVCPCTWDCHGHRLRAPLAQPQNRATRTAPSCGCLCPYLRSPMPGPEIARAPSRDHSCPHLRSSAAISSKRDSYSATIGPRLCRARWQVSRRAHSAWSAPNSGTTCANSGKAQFRHDLCQQWDGAIQARPVPTVRRRDLGTTCANSGKARFRHVLCQQ